MRMKYEFIKLKKHKVLMIVICIICLLKIFEVSQINVNSPFANPKSEKYYQEYIEKYNGVLSDKDIELIEKEKQVFLTAENQRKSVYQLVGDFKQLDKKSVETYKDSLEHSLDVLDRKEAFDYFYNQVEYAVENNRDLFDSRGWQAILEDEYVDIMLIIVLLIINGLIFVSDYEQATYPLLISTQHGRKGVIWSKMKLGFLISVTFICLFTILNDLHYFLNYSFQYTQASMQDIGLFQNAPYSLSLISALFITRFLRIIGYLLIVIVTWISMIKFKHFLIGTFIHGSFYIGLGVFLSHEYLYKIPSPLALIMSSGFLRGNEYRILNKNTEWAVKIQTFFMENSIFLWVGIIMLIIFICFIFKAYYNIYTKRYKKLISFMILFIVCNLLVGCAPIKQSNQYIRQDYLSLASEIVFINDNKFQAYNSSFEKMNYIKDPLYMQNGNIIDFYYNGEKIYFLSSQYGEGFEIFSYDSLNRETELIYQKKAIASNKGLNFMQTDYTFFDDPIVSDNISQFYIYNNILYYTDNNYLYKEDMRSKKSQMITPITSNIAFVEDKIYYCNSRMDLECYSIKDNKFSIISDDMIYQMIQYIDKIYYVKASDEGIYCFDGINETKLLNKSQFIYAIDNNNIYYKNGNDLHIYDSHLKKDKIIKDRNIYNISIIDEQTILFTEEKNNVINTIRADRYLENESILRE